MGKVYHQTHQPIHSSTHPPINIFKLLLCFIVHFPDNYLILLSADRVTVLRSKKPACEIPIITITKPDVTMQFFRYIPLMGVVFLIYNLVAWSHPDPVNAFWPRILLLLSLPSGASLGISYSMAFISLAMLMLFLELVKSTTASNVVMIEQLFSTLVFIAFLIQFLISPRVAEPTFFALLVISLVEMLAGYIILLKVSRKDISIR